MNPRTPDRIKRLKGTAQKVRLSGDSLIKPLQEIPECPSWINKHGQEAYERLSEIFFMRQLLNAYNIDSLFLLCNELGSYLELSEDINTEGYVFIQRNPSKMKVYIANPKVKMKSEAFRNAKMMLIEFGMTTSSLSKILSTIGNQPTDNEYEKFLRG